MEQRDLVEFFESFNNQLVKLFPKPFTFSDLEKAIVKGKLPLHDSKTYIEEDNIKFDWITNFIEMLNVIRAIIKTPKSVLFTTKELKPISQVGKMSSTDLDDTAKNTKLWKKDQSGVFKPEKMISDTYLEGLQIYENRFVIFVIEEMEEFLNGILNYLYSKVRFINSRYIDDRVIMSDLKTLDELCDFKNFTFSDKDAKTENSDSVPLLTLSDAPFLKTIQQIISLKSKVYYLHSTNFYKIVKMATPLRAREIHMSNIMNDSPTYSKVFRFYQYLVDLKNQFFVEDDHVLTHAYKDYALIRIMLTLKELGYVFPKDELRITQKHLLIPDELVLDHPAGVTCSVTSSHRKINLLFEVKYQEGKFHKQINLENRRRSLINFDICANINEMEENNSLESYYSGLVYSKVDKGFTNSFVITPYCSNSDANIIYLSPIHEKTGSHLKSALVGCTLFVEGDQEIYHTICPICGSRVDGEDDDGNIRCPHCSSIYSFLRNGDHFNYKDTIWIKRINNGEIKEL